MQKPLRLKSLLLKFLPPFLLFWALNAAIPLLSPTQIPKLEEGIFREGDRGPVLTVRDGTISYGNSKAPYDLWIGKGKRFLTPKSVLGDLYAVEEATGNKVPGVIGINNERNALSACTVRSNRVEICFKRVR